jgi:hypothetical protein
MPSDPPNWINLLFTESPKWFALFFSGVAITFSWLSWTEAHRARINNEAVNRPNLSLSAEMPSPRGEYQYPLRTVMKFTLTNNGKSPALVTWVRARPFSYACELDFTDTDTEFDFNKGREILAGGGTSFSVPITIKSACKYRQLDSLVSLRVKTIYKDVGSGAEYTQELSVDRLDLLFRDAPTPEASPEATKVSP